MRNRIWALTIFAVSITVAVPVFATPITVDDLIGTIDVVTPPPESNPTAETARANTLINQFNSTIWTTYPTNPDPGPTTIGNYTYNIELTSTTNVPYPLLYNAVGGTQTNAGDIGSVLLDGHTYLTAKYGENSAVFYIGGFTGFIDSIFNPWGTSPTLSHITLHTGVSTVVPEPAPLLLLGSGLVLIGGLRLYRRKR